MASYRVIVPRFAKGEVAFLVVAITPLAQRHLGHRCWISEVGPWQMYVGDGTDLHQFDYFVRFENGTSCYVRDYQLRKLFCPAEPKSLSRPQGGMT